MQQVPPALAWLINLVLLGCLSTWAVIIHRLARRQPVVPYEARANVPWRGSDIVLIILIQFAVYAVPPLAVDLQNALHSDAQPDAQPAAKATVDADEVVGQHVDAKPFDSQVVKPALKSKRIELTPAIALSLGVASVIGVVMMIAFLRIVAGATWADLGLTTADWPRDVAMGAAGMFAISIPVYTIQAIVTHWFPSEHPLLKMLEDHPNPMYLLISGTLAVLIAPLIEELVFRVILQGWLEANEDGWRERLPHMERYVPHGVIPVLLSATLFALLHWTQGPDPLALFPLALVLGYLYRQTHRLLPSLTMHLCFNGLSLFLFAATHFGKGA